MIELYKMCNGAHDVPADKVIKLDQNHLRGHSIKNKGERSRKDIGRWTLLNRITHVWNYFPAEIVLSPMILTFESQ